MDKLYRCEQVAERYGVNTATVWRWVREKKLHALKIGKRYLIRESDMQHFESSDNLNLKK